MQKSIVLSQYSQLHSYQIRMHPSALAWENMDTHNKQMFAWRVSEVSEANLTD